MYICVCKAVTDRQLEVAIDDGICSRRELFECFGVGGDCGKCNRDIRELLNNKTEHKLNAAASELIA